MGSYFVKLNPLRLLNRPLILHVPSVQRPGRLEEQNMDLILGNWAVLESSGHDEELAFLQPNVTIPELHPESTLDQPGEPY